MAKVKRIIFMAVDNGIDGMEKDSILYASFDEDVLDSLIKADKSKAWRTKKEKIIDVEQATKKALAKLDGVDRLLLGLPTETRFFDK